MIDHYSYCEDVCNDSHRMSKGVLFLSFLGETFEAHLKLFRRALADLKLRSGRRGAHGALQAVRWILWDQGVWLKCSDSFSGFCFFNTTLWKGFL